MGVALADATTVLAAGCGDVQLQAVEGGYQRASVRAMQLDGQIHFADKVGSVG